MPVVAQDQRFSFGVTAGLPLDKTTSNMGSSRVDNNRFTFGVSIEGYLNEHLSVDFNPLYKRTTSYFSNTTFSGVGNTLSVVFLEQASKNHSLELPVIGKYTFREKGKRWRPFVGAGFAFQTAWQTDRTLSQFGGANSGLLANQGDKRTPFDAGAVFSAGLRMGKGRFQVVPELRYTRWGVGNLAHHQDQPEFLLTFRF
jgi:hypothetical protein